MDSSIAGYFDNYARALREANRYDDALQAHNRAISMAPGYAFVYFGKAKTLETMGSADQALAVLNEAMRIEPNNAGVWEYRGKLMGLLGRYPAAYAAFEHSLEIEPTRSHVYLTRADVEIAQGRKDDALNDLRRYPSDGKDHSEAQEKIASLQSSPAPPLTVTPDARQVTGETSAPDTSGHDAAVVAQAQMEAAEAQERAAKAEAAAQAERDLTAAHEREKKAQEEKAAADAEASELKRKEDAAKKAEAEPINILTKDYALYVIIKRCHEKRDGYATVWINDVELDRGRGDIKAIESKLKAQDEHMDDKAAWTAANERADTISVLDDTSCHEALADLDGAYKKADPEAAMTKKDF